MEARLPKSFHLASIFFSNNINVCAWFKIAIFIFHYKTNIIL